MFLESPTFLFYFLHFFTALSCPLQLLGLYCIVFKTPRSMCCVKWILFNFHFWCLVFDISVTLLTVPLLIFPAIGGVPLGILTVFFGVPTEFQAYLIFTLLFIVFDANILTFENRYYQLFAKQKIWRHLRIPIIAINYLVTITFTIPLFLNVPDQSFGLDTVYKLIPNLSDEIKSRQLYVLATDCYLFLAIFLFMTVFQLFEYIPLVIITHWNIARSVRESRISRYTMKLQEKFLHAIYAQSCAFFTSCFIPYVYVLIACSLDYYNQAANNFIFIFLSLHGVICTLILLWVHIPYRNVCINILHSIWPSVTWFPKLVPENKTRTAISVLM